MILHSRRKTIMPDLSKVTALLPGVADYLIYAAIAIVTLIGVLKCLCPLWHTTGALKRAIRKLQEDAGNTGKPVWQEPGFVGKRLRGSWMRFLQNAEQLDRRGLPTNVEDYINDDTVTHGPGNATLAELIPNLLTSLGILGTFMGLSNGLASLNMGDATTLMAGIPNLLGGMKFAFGTSVAGISCSLVFNMLNRIAQGSSYHAIDDFVSSFTQLAMSRPLDNDVQLICQNQDRNHMLEDVTGTLTVRFADQVGSAVSEALSPVAESMDRFLLGTTRNQIEGVTHIVNQFVDRMNASLNGQFLELGKTLTLVNQNQAVTAARADASLRSVNGIVSNAEKLQNLTDNVMSHFDAYVTEMSAARNRDEHFEEGAQALLSRLQQNSQEQTNMIVLMRKYQEELNTSLNRFREQSSDSMISMRKGGENNRTEMENASRELRESGREFGKNCEKFAAEIGESFNGTMNGFANTMNEMLNSLNSKIDVLAGKGNKNETVAVTGEIQRTLTELKRDVTGIYETLDKMSKEA